MSIKTYTHEEAVKTAKALLHKELEAKKEVKFIPAEINMDEFTEDQLDAILLFLQTKYEVFGEEGDHPDLFNKTLSVYLTGWCKEVYETMSFNFKKEEVTPLFTKMINCFDPDEIEYEEEEEDGRI